MDRAESIIARKRLDRFPQAWRDEVASMPAKEREVVLELIALLDARPCDEEGTTK